MTSEHVQRLTKVTAEQFLVDEESVDLSVFTEMDDEAAAALGEFEGTLYLDSLVELSDTASKHLGNHRGDLYLNGIRLLSENAAKHLATHRGPVFLRGVESLNGPEASIIQSLIWPHVPHTDLPTTYVHLPDVADFEEGQVNSGALLRLQMVNAIQHFIDEVERVSQALGNAHHDERAIELNQALRCFSYSVQAAYNGGRITKSLAKTLKTDFQNDSLSQQVLEDFINLGFTIEDDAKPLLRECFEA